MSRMYVIIFSIWRWQYKEIAR